MAYKVSAAIIYFFIVCFLAVWGWIKTQTADDYMVAGRAMRSGVMSLSYGATFTGTTIIIGLGGAAALFGFPLLWLSFFNIMVGVFIAFVFFGKRTRRMGMALNAHTFAEILGERYQSRFIQGFAGLVIFFFIPIYAAAILIGIGHFIEVSLHVPFVITLVVFSLFLTFYVVIGGLKGVMYVDAFQGIVMLVIMGFLCFWTYDLLGGVVPAHQALGDMAAGVPQTLVRDGHLGWTAGLALDSLLWWNVYSSFIFGIGIGALAQPQLVVRFLAVPSDRELNWAVLLGGIFILVISGGAVIVGSLSNVLFAQKFDVVAIAMAGGNIDKIIPLYVETIMPAWFAPLFLVGLLAASMAALSSQYHVGGTSLGRDFYGKALGVHEGGEVFTSKIGVALTIFATLLWGMVLPPNSIMISTAFFFSLCAATLLPMYVLGLYWRRTTRAGAIISMLGGFCICALLMVFVHYTESVALGVCNLFFGTANLVADFQPGTWPWKLQYIDPLVIAMPISFLLCIIASILTPRMPFAHLRRCFKK